MNRYNRVILGGGVFVITYFYLSIYLSTRFVIVLSVF